MGTGSSAPSDAPAVPHAARPARVVVVPLAVPDDARDLGLGLAALIHAFVVIAGESVALAQLLTRDGNAESAEPRPIEAFLSAAAWADLAGPGTAQERVSLVITGRLEPPTDGRGALLLVAFEPRSGRTRADIEVALEAESAGASLREALDALCDALDGEPGLARDVDELGWDALEGVLRAERCVLHNPLRGGPHDRLAALLHLGRAIADAPAATFPAGRLAAIALDSVIAAPEDARAAGAAVRALERAIHDAPESAELREAAAALHVRTGAFGAAEAHVRGALERHPERPRLYALLSEARRGLRDLDGAEEAVADGLRATPDDPLLLTEGGVVALERGAFGDARARFSDVLARSPGYPPAFVNLLGCAARASDTALLEELAQRAAELSSLPTDVTRRVLRLYVALPPATVGSSAPRARAERTARLAARVVAESADAWAELALARAQIELGEVEEARAHLNHVEAQAPRSALAAEACRARFALEQPGAALELESVVREAHTRTKQELAALSARAQSLADANDVWPAHFALGMAERHRERWEEARVALEAAIARSPGATPAHIELVAVHVALGSAAKALDHADRACALEGETARTLAVRATALLAASRHADAREAIDRALELDAGDLRHRALAERIRATTEPASALTRLREMFGLKRR